MQLRNTTREQPEINLTSLIDVVFLLLIFFMISTTFEHAAALKVTLPEAATSESENRPEQVILSIDSTGRMAIGEQRLQNNRAETLGNALREVWQPDGNQALIINADAETAHRHVVTAMDVASKLGIVNMSIATVDTDTDSGTAGNAADQAADAADADLTNPDTAIDDSQ